MPSAPTRDSTLSSERVEKYPQQLWWFFAAMIGTVSVFQLASFIHNKIFWRISDSQEEKRGTLRRIALAILNAYRALAFRTTLEIGSYSVSLAEMAVTVIYIVALFTWEFINTTTTAGVKLSQTYWGTRAGALAAIQMPLIVALGTKNNIISRMYA